MHILDLVQNSISAGAKRIEIRIVADRRADLLTITIVDDGRGMSEAFVEQVTSPFATTRTTRKVGLGVPLFEQLARMTNGSFDIESRVGQGTVLRAVFQLSHLDLPPMGDLNGTIQSLLIAAPESPDFLVYYAIDDKSFEFDTRQIRAALGGLPLNLPDVLAWVQEYLSENIMEVGSL